MRIHIQSRNLDDLIEVAQAALRGVVHDDTRLSVQIQPSVIIDGVYVLSAYSDRKI